MNEAVSKQYNKIKLYPFRLELLKHFRGSSETWSSRGKDIKDSMNTIYFVLDGDGYVDCNGKRKNLLKNSVYFIPTNCKRQFGCKTFIEKYWCFFQTRNFVGVDLFDGIQDVVCLAKDVNFSDFFESQSHLVITRLQLFIFELLEKNGLFEESLHKKNIKIDRYEKVFKYIENNLSAKIIVPDIATCLDMTPQGFSRAFHRDLGFTIKHFLSQRLNQKSCDLLLLSDLKIRDIAFELGYEDEYYFTRFFTKMNNLSPSQYRMRIKINLD